MGLEGEGRGQVACRLLLLLVSSPITLGELERIIAFGGSAGKVTLGGLNGDRLNT